MIEKKGRSKGCACAHQEHIKESGLDKKVSLLLHVIIYRYIHTVGHSMNLTYFPRKLLSKRLCSLKAKEKNRVHRLKSLCYKMCKK